MRSESLTKESLKGKYINNQKRDFQKFLVYSYFTLYNLSEAERKYSKWISLAHLTDILGDVVLTEAQLIHSVTLP